MIEERVEEWEKGWKETVVISVISVISVSELLTSKVTAVAAEAVRPMASPQGFALLLEQQVMATSHSNELSIFTLRVGNGGKQCTSVEFHRVMMRDADKVWMTRHSQLACGFWHWRCRTRRMIREARAQSQ